MSEIVTPDSLAVYLDVDLSEDKYDRAQMLIDDAIAQALSVVTVGDVPDDGPTEANLPTGAASVIRAAVARIFLNPTGVTSESTGPYAYGRPAGTGALFSKAERAQLRRMGGGGNAFSVNLLANYQGAVLPPWDAGQGQVTVFTS